MQKVLIMGGSYFIGKAIAERLSSNFDVTLLNRGSNSTPAYAHQLICDRNDFDRMKNVLCGHRFDYAIDVCGLNSNHAEILTKSLNCFNMKALIFISSSAVYDVDNLSIPFKESDRLAANQYWTDYGTNKIAAEETYLKLFRNTATKTIFLRPPYVYGENNYAQRESFIFVHLIGHRPVIIPKSNPLLQFIYAPDLAEIIAELLGQIKLLPQNSVYNVGNSESISCKEWIETCARAAESDVNIIEYDYKADERHVRDFFPFYDYDNVLDVSAIKAICPYETPFIDGLRNTFEWFKVNHTGIQFKTSVIQNEIEILNNLQK